MKGGQGITLSAESSHQCGTQQIPRGCTQCSSPTARISMAFLLSRTSNIVPSSSSKLSKKRTMIIMSMPSSMVVSTDMDTATLSLLCLPFSLCQRRFFFVS